MWQIRLMAGLCLWLAACTPPRTEAPGAPLEFGPTATAEAAASPAPLSVTVELPGPVADAAPEALEALAPGQTIQLDLTLAPGALPNARKGDAWETLSADCAFGPVYGLDEVSVPTGSNHLLMSILPGDPLQHAANFMSCDYAPRGPNVDGEPTDVRVRITGCFQVHEAAIPTARQLVLHPLPASACR